MTVAGETRERLLDAGLRLFARNGRPATTVTEIEELAGLKGGSGGFYRHFRSKDALYEAVVARELAKVGPGPELDPRAPPVTVMAQYLSHCLATLEVLAPLTRVVSHEWASQSDGRSPVIEATFGHHDFLTWPDVRTALRATPEQTMLIVESALVGYRLAVAFFGVPLGGVSPEAFIDDLVLLLVRPD